MAATADLWPEIRMAYGWVHQAATILHNAAAQTGADVRAAYMRWLALMAERRHEAGALTAAIDHFLKVTQSYAPGLFYCYDLAGVPRTNNDLEHVFGGLRYHERRASGRKGASPALVVRGSARIIAAVVTRQRPVSAVDLRPHDIGRWHALRHELEYRQEARRTQRRFRQDPEAYLTLLEEQLLSVTLPA